MKKLLAFILSITLMFSVVGCSSSSNSGEYDEGTDTNGGTDTNYEADTNTEDATIEIMQDGETLTVILTGSVVAVANEMIENSEEMQLSIQFNGSDYEFLGSFSLICSEEGYIYESCWDSISELDLDVYATYSSEEIVFVCPDCTISLDEMETASTGIFINDEFMYQQSFDTEDITFTDGEYVPEPEEGEFQFADQNYMCFVYEGSTINIVSEYIVGEVEVTYSGYIVTCDYGSYEVVEELKYNGDEPFIDVEVTEIDATNENLYLDASVDHETGEILIEIYENGEALNRLKFFAFETIYQDYYTYDENGDVTEIPMTISVDGTSIKINIQEKYETDWIELSDEIYNNSNLYISGYDITDLDSGEVCRFFIQDCGYVVDGTVVYDGLTYRIFKDGYAVSFGAFINSVDTNVAEFTIREEFLLGSFTGDDTGNTVEVTNSQFILNNETYIDIDTEILLIYSMMGSDYPVYIEGELAYSLSCYVYESDNDGVMASFNVYDVINETYLLDNFENFYKD